MIAIIPMALALATGCKPHNAELNEANVRTFLGVSTSPTIFKSALNLDSFEKQKNGRHYQIDCRTFENEEDEALFRLENAPECDPDAFNHGTRNAPVYNEPWILQEGYEVVSQDIEEWRGEAIMTWEGDFQITFHSRVGGANDDFRFAIVVDPDFQPTECVTGESGEPELQAVDGDWLANWSADLDGGTRYFLNAGAYQFNPSSVDDLWALPEDWLAGYAAAKFVEDDFLMRTTRYGEPGAYAEFEVDTYYTTIDANDLFYAYVTEGGNPEENNAYQENIERANQIVEETQADLALLQDPDDEGDDWTYAPVVHTNTWREPDGNAIGLDSWVELHYNWITFDEGSQLEVGGQASGEFSLLLEGYSSQSVIFITGKFKTDKIKADNWTAPNLYEDKLEEYGTVLCGEDQAAAE